MLFSHLHVLCLLFKLNRRKLLWINRWYFGRVLIFPHHFDSIAIIKRRMWLYYEWKNNNLEKGMIWAMRKGDEHLLLLPANVETTSTLTTIEGKNRLAKASSFRFRLMFLFSFLSHISCTRHIIQFSIPKFRSNKKKTIPFVASATINSNYVLYSGYALRSDHSELYVSLCIRNSTHRIFFFF